MKVTLEDVSKFLEKAVNDLEEKSNKNRKIIKKDIEENTQRAAKRHQAEAEAYKQHVDNKIKKSREEEKEENFKRYAKSLLAFHMRVPNMMSIKEVKGKLLDAYPEFIQSNLTDEGLDIFLNLFAEKLEDK